MISKKGFLLFEALIAIMIAGIVLMVYTSISYYASIQSNMIKSQSTKQILDVIRSRLLLLAKDSDSDGYFELPKADENNTVPIQVALTTDSWGRVVYYFPYDYGSPNTDANYTTNTTQISPNQNILARLVSGGSDGVVDTTAQDTTAINDDIIVEIGIGETNHYKLYGGSEISTQTRSYNSAIISPAQPQSPTNGLLWYDSTNAILKVYDGTSWKNVTTP